MARYYFECFEPPHEIAVLTMTLSEAWIDAWPKLNPAGSYVTDAEMVRNSSAAVTYGPGDWHTVADEARAIADIDHAAKVVPLVCSRLSHQRRAN